MNERERETEHETCPEWSIVLHIYICGSRRIKKQMNERLGQSEWPPSEIQTRDYSKPTKNQVGPQQQRVPVPEICHKNIYDTISRGVVSTGDVTMAIIVMIIE